MPDRRSRHSILIVCTANRCRSPMAAALLARQVKQRGEAQQWQIDSAGTWAVPDLPVMPFSLKVMKRQGLDLSQHRARLLTAELVEAADLILAMTQYQAEAIRAEFPEASEKTLLVSQLIDQTFDIDDPVAGTEDDYGQCAAELEEILQTGYERLVEWLQRKSVV